MALVEEILIRKEKAFKSDQIEVFYFLTDILTELPHKVTDSDLKDIVFLIQKDYLEEAKSLLEKAKTNENKCSKKIKFIEKLIKEKENYQLKPDEEKKKIEEFKENGREFYKSKELDKSIVIYKNALYFTHDNIFNYYIGKIYYKMKDYNQSENYLLEYCKNEGCEKYIKSKLYLTIMDKKRSRFKKYNKHLKELKEFSGIYYDCPEFGLHPYEFDSKSDKYDKKPKNILRKIRMTEEDFVKKS